MLRHILVRTANIVPLLLVISVLVFLIVKLGPGDPIKDQFGSRMSEEAIETIRRAYGLDRPLLEQYFVWLQSMVLDGGGTSIAVGSPVPDIILPAFRNTLVLGVAATVLAAVLGVLIGFVAGVRNGKLADRVTMLFVQIGSNLPIYWFGLILIWLFGVQLRWLPTTGMYDLRGDGGFLDLLRHLILPAFAAALVSMLIIARFVRASVIENKHSDYFRTLRSQGFTRRSLYGRHIGRNILPPIVNTTGLTIGSVISGVVFVEIIFSWPGIGSVLMSAIGGSDFPVLQSGILLVAAAFVVVNLLTDVTLDLLNPRLRHLA